MSPITHDIDPDADTVITLRNASAVFAPWIDESERPKRTEDSDRSTMEDMRNRELSGRALKKKSKKGIRQSRIMVEALAAGEDQSDAGDNGCVEAETRNNEAHTSASIVVHEADEIEDIHFRVSSRHLMLASPWFKRTLAREGWAESSRSEEDGLFHITADDWDAEAFHILLKIFHLRNRHVPRVVTLEFLGKIAVLVDYYECGEAIELFTGMWIASLKANTLLPKWYSRELIIWIWVSWVFDLSSDFEHATIVAISQTEKPLHTLDLPIPQKVSVEIDRKRCNAIKSVITQLNGLLDKYRSNNYECWRYQAVSFECGSFLFGAMTKELDRLGLLLPRPEEPFVKLSFNGLRNALKTIQSPIWCSVYSSGFGGHGQHPCSLETAVDEIISTAQVAITNLNLSETKTGQLESSK